MHVLNLNRRSSPSPFFPFAFQHCMRLGSVIWMNRTPTQIYILDARKNRAGVASLHLFSTPSQKIIPGIGVEGGGGGGNNSGKFTQRERKISCILKSIKLFENNSQELAQISFLRFSPTFADSFCPKYTA